MKNIKILLLLTLSTFLFSFVFAQDIQIHGFISQGAIYSTEYNYIASNSKDFSFDLQEIGINFQTDVSDRLHLGMQLLSRDVGVYGEGRVTIDWAYGDYYISDAVQVAFGRVKNKIGFYTPIQDFDFLRTWAVLPSSIYDMGLRTINSTVDGMQLHGNIDTDLAGNLDYSLTFGGMKLGRNSDIAPYVGQLTTEPIQVATLKYDICANVVYNTPIDGLRINLSAYHLEDFNFDPINKELDLTAMGMGVLPFSYEIGADINSYYFGAQYTLNKLEITTEYNRGKRDYKEVLTGLPDAVLQAVGQVAVNEYSTEYHGGYLGLAYRLNQQLSIGGYYQMALKNIDNDSDDPANKGNDMALSVAFYSGYNMVIKLEGHYVDGYAPLSLTLNDSFDADTWMYAVAKVSYNF